MMFQPQCYQSISFSYSLQALLPESAVAILTSSEEIFLSDQLQSEHIAQACHDFFEHEVLEATLFDLLKPKHKVLAPCVHKRMSLKVSTP